jgi:hypothetical protein
MFQNLAEQCIQQCIQQLRQPLRGSCEPELLAPCSLLCSLLVSRPSPLPHHLQSTTRAIRPDGHATFGLYEMCSAFFVAAAVLTVAGPFTDATPAAAELASSILASTMARLVFLLLVSAALAPAAITPATIAVAPLSPLTTELRSHEGASNSCTFTLAGSYLRGGAVNYILAAILLNLPLASASNGPPSVNQMPSLSVLMAVASAVPAALRTRSRLLSICSPARSILHYFCRCCCCRYPAHPTLSASPLSPLPARSASLALSATPRFAGRGGGGVKGANAIVTTSGEGATSCVMASTVVAGHYTTEVTDTTGSEGSWSDWNDNRQAPYFTSDIDLNAFPSHGISDISDSNSSECDYACMVNESGVSEALALNTCGDTSAKRTVIDFAKRAVTDSNGDPAACLAQLRAVANSLGSQRPERSTLLAIFAVLVPLTCTRATSRDELCLELGVSQRLVLKWNAWIQSALASPSDPLDPLVAIQAAQCAVRTNHGDVAVCEPELRALAFAMGARRIERGTLIAIMAALVCVTDGLTLAAVQIQYPDAKLRNLHKWKRDLSNVLASSVDHVDTGLFSAAELALLD